MATKIRVGGARPHPQNGGVLHKTKPQPRIYANHGGSNLSQGRVNQIAKVPQSASSWHAAAARSQKRGG